MKASAAVRGTCPGVGDNCNDASSFSSAGCSTSLAEKQRKHSSVSKQWWQAKSAASLTMQLTGCVNERQKT